MTSAASFPLPPGQALSAWRRELSVFRPRRLRLAHLSLHRVEALVHATPVRAIDPLCAALLHQVAREAPLERLGLDPEILSVWLREMSAEGLVHRAGDAWRLTERGRGALDSGTYTTSTEERRVFTFTEESEPERSPVFLPLQGPAAALAAPPGWRFDAAALVACVNRPEAWKTGHGFPLDVTTVATSQGADAGSTEWRRVMLDRPEQILLVFVPAGESASEWLGFTVRTEGWVLQSASPSLTLPAVEGRVEVLPDLTVEPSPEAWRDAWRSWRQGRGLSDADAAACHVDPIDEGVRVVAPPALAARLGEDRKEAWLLAGAGRIRVAAPLEIVEAE